MEQRRTEIKPGQIRLTTRDYVENILYLVVCKTVDLMWVVMAADNCGALEEWDDPSIGRDTLISEADVTTEEEL